MQDVGRMAQECKTPHFPYPTALPQYSLGSRGITIMDRLPHHRMQVAQTPTYPVIANFHFCCTVTV